MHISETRNPRYNACRLAAGVFITNADYQIYQIETYESNGRQVKAFTADIKEDGKFVPFGTFTVSANTPDGDLWKVVEDWENT